MYDVRCSLTGDSAEADDLGAALVAAATIVDDAFEARPFQGRILKARQSLLVTRDGRYDPHATMLARAGRRTVTS